MSKDPADKQPDTKTYIVKIGDDLNLLLPDTPDIGVTFTKKSEDKK